MKIVNGYKVYDKSELEYHANNCQEAYGFWYIAGTDEIAVTGADCCGGYRALKEVLSDKENMKMSYKVKEPVFYGDEGAAWLVYILVMIGGNIFQDFFPYGMIFVTFYFFRWRKKYRKGFQRRGW